MTDTTTPGTAVASFLEGYFGMWREPDPGARRPLVEETFTPDGRHVDPLVDATGYAELNDMVTNVHAHYPGFVIERTSGLDQHGDQLRFAWRLTAADGTPVVAGVDIGELAADGRLSRIAGFWGDLPES